MNQPLNGELRSELALTQFGGLQHQVQGEISILNPFMQESLCQGGMI